MNFAHLKHALRQLSPDRYVRAFAELRWDVAKIQEQLRNGVELADIQLLSSAATDTARYAHPLSLARHHAQIYSQHGEDGLLAEIFRRVGLRGQPYFVEIGVGNGQENNTRFLVEQGWKGIWIDGSESGLRQARDSFGAFTNTGALKIIHGLVTAENINGLLDDAGVPDDIAFLSLDIDMNTSHVWRAIQRRTSVACIEYNGSLPHSVDIEVPYDPTSVWDETSWYGASLKTMELIGAGKGLSLVGCDFTGTNVFFVDSGIAEGRFQEPFTAEMHYEFPKFALLNSRNGPLRLTGHPPSPQARRWVSPVSR